MSGQAWTPAPKRGSIPLHPMTFGMLLGRSFAALRHNPKVLVGFAVVLQLVALLITALLLGVIFAFAYARLATVRPGSDDFMTIMAGTIGLTVVFSVGVALLSASMTAIMQGIVAADVALAAVGRKGTLRALWRRMAPAFWRLVLYAVLQAVVLVTAFAVVAFAIFAIAAGAGAGGMDATGLIITLTVLVILGSIPLLIWLSIKLLLVPSALVLEHAPLRAALVRSWRLTRGRFWVAFGVVALIALIMGVAANIVSIPGAIVSTIVTGIVAPTGDPSTSQIIAIVFALLVPQVLVLAVQAIGQIVQCTGATLIYVDSRMRYEGLDQTLIAHTERSSLGWTDDQLGDPFAVDPARAVTSQKPQTVSMPPQAYAPPPAAQAAQYGYPQGYYTQAGAPPAYPPYAAPAPATAAAPPPPAAPATSEPTPTAPPKPIPPASESPWASPNSGA